jgi:D-3-phosphoglycerate dehydrogenase / 2-oxoglutarate reductase
MATLTGKKIFLAEPIAGSEYTYDYLRDTGAELIIGPHVSRPDQPYNEEKLMELGNEVDAFIGMSREKMTKQVLQNSKRLQIVTKTGIGVDHIDVATATECGILVTNTPMNRLAVAEFAIMVMLALTKKTRQTGEHLLTGNWRDDSVTVTELFGKTIGLLGFGGIGRQVAKRLQGWDATLIAYDPYIKPAEAEKFGVKLVDRDTLFKNADILTLHLPLNSETKGSVGKNELQMMKPTAILVNTARGKIVKEADLVEALRSQQIAGAGVDVFESEPAKTTNPLFAMENVIISPHSAGFTWEALRRMAEQAAQNTIQALSGKVPDMEYIVNPEVLDLWKRKWSKL